MIEALVHIDPVTRRADAELDVGHGWFNTVKLTGYLRRTEIKLSRKDAANGTNE